MTASTGIKMIDFQITRGIFDFIAVWGTIEQAMAVKIAVGSTGSIDQFHILEAVDIAGAATLAQTTLARITFLLKENKKPSPRELRHPGLRFLGSSNYSYLKTRSSNSSDTRLDQTEPSFFDTGWASNQISA